MKSVNPFPFSDDNKRYHTWNYYLRHRFGKKIAKVPLDGGFTCPNRDGTRGYGGCTFCTSSGSGEFAGDRAEPLLDQYIKGQAVMRHKWPDADFIPYFQAYTNTYGPLSKIQACVKPFLDRPEVAAIAIATRADCLEPEKIAWLASCCASKEIWLELGVQSVHDATAQMINRGHSYAEVVETVQRLALTPLKICVHLIDGLPGEDEEMMLETVRQINLLPIHAVKLHMLHLMRDTQLARRYAEQPFPLLSREEYVSLVVRQLELLRPEIIIQRLTGDGASDALIAPQWTQKKTIVLNEIDKLMAREKTWQGKRAAHG